MYSLLKVGDIADAAAEFQRYGFFPMARYPVMTAIVSRGART
jgi:hypothetical protein